MSPQSWLRGLTGTTVAAMLLATGGTAALADDISNDVDATLDAAVEVMNLAPGGATGTTTLRVVNANGDGKNGCNLTGGTTLTTSVSSSNTTVASVSPSSVTFTSCGDTKVLTVTTGTSGTAQITLAQTSNNTGGTFNLAPAAFDVVVAAVKTETTTSLSCPASVAYSGSAQTPCEAMTTGQNGFTATPTLDYSANTNAGTASVTATYAGDATHLGSSDTETFAITKAASSTTITCADQTYTGAALEPCAARATGVGGLDVEVTPTYTNNTDAGIADVEASYLGDANHNASDASQTFRIDQATATCTVTGFSGTYDGDAHGLTGTCTGLGGADLTSGLTPGGSHTNAGSHSVGWSFDGGTNYADQAGAATVTIARATSKVEVTCPAGPHPYTAEEQTPCTATVTGPGGLDESAPVTYLANENAGTATAIGNYAGGPNHEASTGSATFEITKATTTTTVTCSAGPHVYTGSDITPCSAQVTGPGLSQSLTSSYSDNRNAGAAGASAAYAGTDNYWASSGFSSFTIARAPSVVTVDCPESVVFTGVAIEPCSAAATGASGLDETLTVDYADNTDAGTATASASYAGDANHESDSGSAEFTIDKAPSTVTVTCPTSEVYTGDPIEPCSASVTGVGGLSLDDLAVTYTDNENVGTAAASATYDGDANHTSDTGSAEFEITKASSVTTVICESGPFVYTGGPIRPCAASVTGAGGLNESPTVSYEDNIDAGTATASASYAGGDNHDGSSDSETFVIGQADAVCVVTGYEGEFDAQEHGLTGTCTGVGDVDLSAGLDLGGSYTDAGSYEVDWSFDGGRNYGDLSGTATVEISKAPSTVEVTCEDGPFTYSGAAHEPCTATVTGIGGLDQNVTVTYTANTNAGTATASATYEGDVNHATDTGSETFVIEKAPSSITLICDGAKTYTGSEVTPCSATASGVDVGPIVLDVDYTDNVNAGPVTASAAWAGDDNHLGSQNTEDFTITQATSTVTVTCPESVVYSGAAQEPCTATATGAGNLQEPLDVTHTDNTDAGTAHANATYTGDANHTGNTGTATFVITQADATCEISGYEGEFDAQEHGLTGTCTGVGDVDLSAGLDLGGSYTDAGSYEVDWSFDGGRNYGDLSDTATVEISKAPSTVEVTCEDGPFTYSGAAHEPCTATVTGIGGLDQNVTVTYTANTNAGTATASATYEGDVNHEADTGSETFVIEKAPSSITLICDGAKTYTGSEVTPCSATASGVDVGPIVLDVDYTDNVNAGPVTASAAWAGDDNHLGSQNTEDFTITQATSTVTVTCPESVVYSGAAQEPCTATATGAGNLQEPLDVTHTDNTDAGTAHANATYTGDANHTGNTGTATFVITQAPSSIAIVCDGATTFTGSALQPCTATASGAGMADIDRPVSYVDNVNAGTATANASWDGDDNHTGSTGSTTFTIAKAPSSVTVTCPTAPLYFTGYALTPTCTARATGVGGLDVPVIPVTFTDNTRVGAASASATFAGGPNHLGSPGQTTFQIQAWTTNGFFKPVDMGTQSAIVWNTVKNGSTVPLKFRLFAGSTELTSTTAVKGFSAVTVNCTSAAEDVIEELSTTGGTSLRYDSTGTQFIQNWQTPKKAGACYRVTMTALDGSTIAAHFKLK